MIKTVMTFVLIVVTQSLSKLEILIVLFQVQTK